MINTTYRVTKLENDDDIVRREFLFGKLREIDRRIYDIKDMIRRGEKKERNDSTSGDN